MKTSLTLQQFNSLMELHKNMEKELDRKYFRMQRRRHEHYLIVDSISDSPFKN